MMKLYRYTTLLLLCSYPCFAQLSAEGDHVVGQNFTLLSEALKDTLRFQVKLPKNYRNSTKAYPLLLLLDGQDHFNYGAGAMQLLTSYDYTPEFLLVGISLDPERRSQWVFGNPDAFLQSLESELFPLIDSQWRTSGERMVHGWEATGGLVIRLLTQKPDLFDGYFAASPTPIYGAYFPSYKKQFLALEHTLESEKVKGKFLYVTESADDFPVQYGMENLVALLQSKGAESLRWTYKKLKGEKHPTTGFPTLFQGLQAYYHNYPDFDVTDFDDFYAKGGFDAVDTYYNERSRRYGFDTAQTEASKKNMRRSIVISAISQNNFKVFDDLMRRLKSQGFLEEQYLNQAYWYAVFYLKHGHPNEAIEILNFLMQKFPESPRPLHGLGRVQEYLGDYALAKSFYKRAVQMGTMANDWRVEEYKADLKNLVGKRK